MHSAIPQPNLDKAAQAHGAQAYSMLHTSTLNPKGGQRGQEENQIIQGSLIFDAKDSSHHSRKLSTKYYLTQLK